MSSKHTKYQTSCHEKKTSVGLNCPPCILSANQAVAFLFAPCADLSLDVTDLQRLQSSLNHKKLLLFDIGKGPQKPSLRENNKTLKWNEDHSQIILQQLMLSEAELYSVSYCELNAWLISQRDKFEYISEVNYRDILGSIFLLQDEAGRGRSFFSCSSSSLPSHDTDACLMMLSFRVTDAAICAHLLR